MVTKCGVARKAMATPRVHVVAFATHSEGMYESMMDALPAAAVYMWRRRGKRVKAGPSR